MITLTLLHPSQATPLQHWQFGNDQSTILIGRALDNHVVLYSAVVSRRHLEIRRNDRDDWELENLGANGTFLNGKPIKKTAVVNGMVVRLAASGPQIQIRLIDEDEQPKLILNPLEAPLAGDQTQPEKDTMVN
ncbi:FHA domain-containing protein [Microcystis aeruginosa]|uniref:FHA domain-containing protein n=2 Tax=Microcystis TaxID=1125 RepID=A0A552HJP5_MICVR|nr:FHA domain-containing protein [Microcystis aeruginosa]NCR09544.1 FHA domain-containing protein [Microcystis aeruginosa LG13-11]TRU69274.1 MAG: FHA domain-containing protein [Microcystis viridis Mv_BB_P_19951000_S69]TRU71471.1 MAG: FHA domain-containing protein [Microcystis viridis Mv_BB_P_19951000_S68D]TRU71612.1 MAG: FHA domain-containing protein [Microcystis viridis Mv_BB_P_19951000_S68]TRU84231.1 MAG: FHA domain-containing protein [Microcystis viridis Mv_BB_P_19951000_S69D]